jgi:putative ABC transport system permease protein
MEFYRRVIERVAALPGVESVAAADSLPFSGQNGGDQIRIEGRPPVTTIDLSTQSEVSVVTTDFAKTMGIPLLSGRFFTERDNTDSTPVVVISERAAQQYWPGEDPLGKRLAFGLSNDHMVWREVIGIVKGIANAGLDRPQRPHVYAPVRQLTFPANFLLVRSTLPPKVTAKTVREAVAAVDPEQSVFLSATLEDWISDSLAERRFGLLLLVLFGALALALACLGVFGVVSHAVAKRTQEIGVRMALGAQPRDVLRLVMTQGMRPALLGVAIGMFGAVGLTRLMRGLLFGVTTTDPLTFVFVTALLSCAALLACYLPARWATRVDPLIALRYE